MEISNYEFLQTVFGADAQWAHVTSFLDDPADIPADRRGVCWAGGYNQSTYIQPHSNQYYCISTFYADKQTGRAVRRKADFRATHVIVADDVREKLDVAAVERLPAPTFKLRTSPGSEQWGWVLDRVCTDRTMVENLLDGLVERGLAPDGKDPGMKGVTRYVRLPEGVNTKASRVKANGGTPPRCKMLEWNPTVRVSIEQLARPFNVDLHAERRDTRVDGAAELPDHPLLNTFAIHVKETRSAGRFDITCPWVNDHTGRGDDGSAIFTNADGSLGFKCHHGSCSHRTGRDLIDYVESTAPGFKQRLSSWQTIMLLQKIGGAPEIDFMGKSSDAVAPAPVVVDHQALLDALRRLPAHTSEALTACHIILKAVDSLDHGSRLVWHNQIRDYMRWNKTDFDRILQEQRVVWYASTATAADFFNDFVYVAEQDHFYNSSKNLWLTPQGFQHMFGHLDNEARSSALLEGRVQKVDKLDYAPGQPKIFTERGITYANLWDGKIEQGVPGDVRLWLDHFDALGWQAHKEHILQWMAYTLRHPERKINHMLILAGGEGNGKDYLLTPLIKAMGSNCTTIHGDELLSQFDDYLFKTKYLHINECDLGGDRREAATIQNKLKPIASSPPEYLRVNQKGIKALMVRNIVNGTMTSNSAVPLEIRGNTRRFYACWTDTTIRDENGDVTPFWQSYWDTAWKWMRDQEGWKACVHYLMTQVDISMFDPGAAPPVTDYLRTIQEAGEDPIANIIKEMISRKLDVFSMDLVKPDEARTALKTAGLLNLDLVKTPHSNVLGKIAKQNGLIRSLIMNDGATKHRIWAVRNFDRYEGRLPRDIYDEFVRQQREYRGNNRLVVVKKEEV